MSGVFDLETFSYSSFIFLLFQFLKIVSFILKKHFPYVIRFGQIVEPSNRFYFDEVSKCGEFRLYM